MKKTEWIFSLIAKPQMLSNAETTSAAAAKIFFFIIKLMRRKKITATRGIEAKIKSVRISVCVFEKCTR